MTDSRFKAEREYLIHVAEMIHEYMLPKLSGQALARAMDCINVTLRVAVTIGNAEQAGDLPTPLPSFAQEALAWEDIDQQFLDLSDSLSKPKPESRTDFAVEDVESFLRGDPRGTADLKVLEVRRLDGGRSKLTGTVVQEGASRLPRELVIRQDWATVVRSSVRSEFGVLQKLWENRIQVPEPLILESGDTALGAPFIVVARVKGQQQGDLLTAPSDDGLVFGAVAELGRIHALGDGPFEGLPGINECNFTVEQLAATLASFRDIVEQFHLPQSPLLDESLDWLDRTVHQVSGRRTLVHGDFGFHNLLFDAQRVSGVLDWEVVHLGNPAYDLGYIRAVVEQQVDWDDAMKQYVAAGGPEIDPFTLDWFTLFSSFWLYTTMLRCRAGLVSGAMHDAEIATICAHVRLPLLRQIAGLHHRIVRNQIQGEHSTLTPSV
jgi:aminoglycoside phosphotransferase (APT) family kinase protein